MKCVFDRFVATFFFFVPSLYFILSLVYRPWRRASRGCRAPCRVLWRTSRPSPPARAQRIRYKAALFLLYPVLCSVPSLLFSFKSVKIENDWLNRLCILIYSFLFSFLSYNYYPIDTDYAQGTASTRACPATSGPARGRLGAPHRHRWDEMILLCFVYL